MIVAPNTHFIVVFLQKMVLISCFIMFIFVVVGRGSIYKNLKHFETIHADDVIHTVVKRGTPAGDHPFNKIKEVNFNTHGRDFRLILTPKRSVLHSKFKAYSVDGNGKETTVHIGKIVTIIVIVLYIVSRP
mgnify:CR=1 FL=1